MKYARLGPFLWNYFRTVATQSGRVKTQTAANGHWANPVTWRCG